MLDLNKPGDLVIKPRYSPRIKLLVAVIVAVALLTSAGLIYNYLPKIRFGLRLPNPQTHRFCLQR